MLKRIPEPELMESEEQCSTYNQSLVDNENALSKFIEIYNTYIGIFQGSIIDLGSGTANFIIELCKVHPDLTATCYEGSSAMIKIANKNISDNDLQDRITVIQDNFFNAKGTFDVVIANRVLHHISNTKNFWSLINTLSENILVCDLERPKKLKYIQNHFDIDVKNSFKAAYNISEVKEQTRLYNYNVLREKVGYELFTFIVYQNK
jgi:2-polyprenyl-3-methyl-5-hydroxy-6-metoxy-1,4-benzoquinol methylase